MIIGIDPGKDGGIAVIHEKLIKLYTIPKIKGSKEVDYRELYRIINMCKGNTNYHFYIEDVHSLGGMSAGSNFSFGHICGTLLGMIIATNCPYTLVQPKVWQKVMFQGVPEIRKLGKNGKKGPRNTKAMALIAAKRLFPDMDFLPTPRCSKPHDGLVDSILIAEYGRRLA